MPSVIHCIALFGYLYVTIYAAKAPSDHLIPPPAPAVSVNIQKSIPLAPFVQFNQNVNQGVRSPPPEPPGFMQRVARWFGYGNNNNNGNILANSLTSERTKEKLQPQQQQQQQASYLQPQYKEAPQAYQYHRPKAPCNPCNKVPWLPMFQYPTGQFHTFNNNNPPNNNNQPILGPNHNKFNYPINQQPPQPNPYATPPQFQQQLIPQYAPNFNVPNTHVQRAVKFSFPNANSFQYLTQQQLTPIPVPNLSATPIPPLYNAVPFRNQFTAQQQLRPTQQFNTPNNYFNNNNNNNNNGGQQQPYHEHLSQPSEIQTVLPTQIPANDIHSSSPAFEVIQSVPVTDFVSSIEYPAKITQSEIIDLSDASNLNFNQNIDQHFDPPNTRPANHHFPQLIELGSYERPKYQTNHDDHISQPIIVHHNHNVPIDNFVEASSHNITIRHENHLDIGNYHSTYSPTLQQDIFVPTQIPPVFSSTYRPDPITDEQPQFSQTSVIDLLPPPPPPSPSSSQTPSGNREFFKKDRDTPKNIPDDPIIYSHNNLNNNVGPLFGSSPRPFTRDPNELTVQSSTFSPSTNNNWQTQLTTPAPTSSPWTYAPTPTSTYSSVDASGQWAGMSPPAQFQQLTSHYEPPATNKRTKQIHQIIIPYTTKNKPQPFKVRESHPEQIGHPTTDNRYSGWSNSHEHQEFHEEQESKLVTATQPTNMPTRKTTKYLTKILASNIRELLRKEQDFRNRTKQHVAHGSSSSGNVDLNILQKNIDDWTEQEFTSLSHKPSTVSIRGRSKHIPHEYLTTTPSMRQGKTTKLFATTESPQTTSYSHASVFLNNNDFYPQSIEDNHIGHSERINKIEISSKGTSKTTKRTTTTTTTTMKTTTTTTQKPNTQPFYIRNVQMPNENEVWQKVKVSISPLTKEKIYVVTPQPRYHIKTSILSQETVTPTATTTTTIDGIGTFKSPRFLVRPTPATSSNGSSHSSTSTGSTKHPFNSSKAKTKISPYSPELFGLMGISAYIPAAPVDVLDGHSRVITVVTPTPHTKKRSTDDAEHRTSTTQKSSTLKHKNTNNNNNNHS